MAEVREEDGRRGGKYFVVDLSDGRALHVSRKSGDGRVWLGRPDQPGSYRDQRGGVGTISKASRRVASPSCAEPGAARDV